MDTRTELILKYEEDGRTLVSVGDELGISRERVRQIFKKITGRGWGIQRRTTEQELRDKAWMDTAIFACRQCGREVNRRFRLENGYKNASVFCSDKCRGIFNRRDFKVTKICVRCGKGFHPFRNWDSPSNRGKALYCSRDCYWKAGGAHQHIAFKPCEICGVWMEKINPRRRFCPSCGLKRIKARDFANRGGRKLK